MTIAPLFGMRNIPMRAKAGFSVFIAILLDMALPVEVPEYTGIMGYTLLILAESATGLLIGFSAHIASIVIQFTGRVMDMEIGMSMASMFDPLTRSQASLTGSLYQYIILTMLLVTNMHYFLLRALADSFKIIPIGGAKFAGAYETMTGTLGEYFLIGFRLVLPIFTVTMLLNVILGILAKVASQMNMFSVGIQLKLVVGLGTMFFVVGILPRMSNIIFTQMRLMVTEVIKGMH
jgi:flagellar biosynthetic protein FliR